jgi:hypothetical protein
MKSIIYEEKAYFYEDLLKFSILEVNIWDIEVKVLAFKKQKFIRIQQFLFQ